MEAATVWNCRSSKISDSFGGTTDFPYWYNVKRQFESTETDFVSSFLNYTNEFSNSMEKSKIENLSKSNSTTLENYSITENGSSSISVQNGKFDPTQFRVTRDEALFLPYDLRNRDWKWNQTWIDADLKTIQMIKFKKMELRQLRRKFQVLIELLHDCLDQAARVHDQVDRMASVVEEIGNYSDLIGQEPMTSTMKKLDEMENFSFLHEETASLMMDLIGRHSQALVSGSVFHQKRHKHIPKSNVNTDDVYNNLDSVLTKGQAYRRPVEHGGSVPKSTSQNEIITAMITMKKKSMKKSSSAVDNAPPPSQFLD